MNPEWAETLTTEEVQQVAALVMLKLCITEDELDSLFAFRPSVADGREVAKRIALRRCLLSRDEEEFLES